ncbi:hypothetical protein [Streptomyces sp. NBC_00268]|uniref:hypothetical protein n=1 Tax=Streptomyces sp. NBC_00268 TaxID=2975695 RepID=UPI00225A5A20|nr:hypothetical protein [Streptomyces sp. NBC_00268]MCX5181159.1 hypothetical protein [Streptomyces sp. NBC_00268]
MRPAISISATSSGGDLRTLAANTRTAAEGRYAGTGPGWQAGVEWTLLWIENTASQLTEGRS